MQKLRQRQHSTAATQNRYSIYIGVLYVECMETPNVPKSLPLRIHEGLERVLGDCPLERGIQVNIKDCVSGPPFISAACVDQDLIHIEADRLRFGEQDTDRCVARPITLDADSYVRVTQP